MTIDDAVADLRARRARGERAAEMLGGLAADGLTSTEIRLAFAEAFGLDSYAVGPIGGWLPGGGGELSLEQVAGFLDPELDALGTA